MPRKKQTSDNLPAKWERLAADHAAAGKLLRELVVSQLEDLQQELEEYRQLKAAHDWGSEEEPPKPPAGLRYLRSHGESLVRAVELERQACSMNYRDSNVAIQRVQQLGFLIQKPDGAIEIDATVIE